MEEEVQIDLVKIGNSRGIRLPQSIIKQCGFKNSVEVELVNSCLILKASKESRENWGEIFSSKSYLTKSEDIEMMAITNNWDAEEWEW